MGELAQWQSHKIVRAGKVLPQQIEDTGHCTSILTVEDANGAPCKVEVSSDFFARGMPTSDYYVVIYDDGYKSWSPARAFEEGYLRL